MRRFKGFFIAYGVVLAVTLCILAVGLAGDTWHAATHMPGSPARFAMAPKDRPLLESVRCVEDARNTGVALFWFDGVLYVTRNLPEEYVDYSAWYTRLP